MAVNYYTARSNDDLQRIAQQQYQSYYDQLRRAAQQKADRETLALENQRAGIQRSYAQQQEESAKQYRQAYSQVDREILRRGMQRSSYGAQRLANVNLEQAEAAQKIQDAQAGAEGNLDAQIAQLQGQLADTLAGYDAGQAGDVMARYNELQSEEYDRAREAAQYAESIRQSDQQLAYSYVTSILAAGKDPSDDLLNRAGLSRQDANLLKKETAVTGGGGGGGGSRSGGNNGAGNGTGGDGTGAGNQSLADWLRGLNISLENGSDASLPNTNAQSVKNNNQLPKVDTALLTRNSGMKKGLKVRPDADLAMSWR